MLEISDMIGFPLDDGEEMIVIHNKNERNKIFIIGVTQTHACKIKKRGMLFRHHYVIVQKISIGVMRTRT